MSIDLKMNLVRMPDIPTDLIDAANAWRIKDTPELRNEAVSKLLLWIASIGKCPVCWEELTSPVTIHKRIKCCGKNTCIKRLDERLMFQPPQ